MKLFVFKKKLFSRITLILAPIAIIAVFIIPSCKDQRTDTSNLVLPDSNLSYSRDIDPLFAQTCMGSQCHSGSTQDVNLEPPSYSKLRNFVPQLVASKDTNSLLLQRLNGRLPPKMPSNQTPLTDNQINGIRQWIIEGIKDN